VLLPVGQAPSGIGGLTTLKAPANAGPRNGSLGRLECVDWPGVSEVSVSLLSSPPFRQDADLDITFGTLRG
jgi:hypothetical protein